MPWKAILRGKYLLLRITLALSLFFFIWRPKPFSVGGLKINIYIKKTPHLLGYKNHLPTKYLEIDLINSH